MIAATRRYVRPYSHVAEDRFHGSSEESDERRREDEREERDSARAAAEQEVPEAGKGGGCEHEEGELSARPLHERRANAAASFSRVNESSSGIVRVAPRTVRKFVSPSQRGTTCRCA